MFVKLLPCKRQLESENLKIRQTFLGKKFFVFVFVLLETICKCPNVSKIIIDVLDLQMYSEK
jgi:hypothetical protein